jgi:heparan-alpha-glucosaminide N-acetyltransferase
MNKTSETAAGSKTGNESAFLYSQRIATIDILRALTMVLMIFVNDLWSLKGIPEWLGHVERGVDGIGLADVVFPAFLFIVGLSLPYAINNRRKKGDTEWQLMQHVLLRTIALLIMGVFLVNGETYNAAATGMPKMYWNPMICIAFILIWNTYPDSWKKYIPVILRAIAIITLIFLAIIYRGGQDGNIHRFSPSWWGILGLIGWAYLVSASITVFAKNNFWIILGGWIFFCIVSMAGKAHLIPREVMTIIPSAISGGTLTGLTMGGVLTTMIFQYFVKKGENLKMTLVLLGFSAILIVLSVITRPYWGLAKIGATPAWLYLCSAFTILAFIAIYWVADIGKKAKWFDLIKPAGTATILCYLVPYLIYGIRNFLHISLPEVLRTGGVGLLKTFLFAMLCVAVTGILIRVGVRMKL